MLLHVMPIRANLVRVSGNELRRQMAKDGVVLKTQDDILDDAKKILEQQFGDQPLAANFDEIMAKADDLAYKVYLENESQYAGNVLSQLITETIGNLPIGSWHDLIVEMAPRLDAFFLSLAQGRKSRGGAAFEFFLRYLFKKLDYPFAEQPMPKKRPAGQQKRKRTQNQPKRPPGPTPKRTK